MDLRMHAAFKIAKLSNFPGLKKVYDIDWYGKRGKLNVVIFGHEYLL